MFLLRKAFRVLFIVLIVVAFAVLPLMGIAVQTGIDIVLTDISTILSGFTIALAYCTDLKNKFY